MMSRCNFCPLGAGDGVCAPAVDHPRLCRLVERELTLPLESRYWTDLTRGGGGPDVVEVVKSESFFGAAPGVPSVTSSVPSDGAGAASGGCGACGGGKSKPGAKTAVVPVVVRQPTVIKRVVVKRREV